MSGNPNWLNLSKDALDPTTIGQEIAAQIVDHNDDADAHLGDGQALESHRAAEIIDHLAESVVNDKLKTNARRYVAIVDPDSESDYDTIDSAYEYAVSVGGGDVLVMPGTHYLGGLIDASHTVNIVGLDRDTCTLVFDFSEDKYFVIPEDGFPENSSIYITNLTLSLSSNFMFSTSAFDTLDNTRLIFTECNFLGKHFYVHGICERLIFNSCYFDCGTGGAVEADTFAVFNDCTIDTSLGSGTAKFYVGAANDSYVSFISCFTPESVPRPINIFCNAGNQYLKIFGCYFQNMVGIELGATNGFIIDNFFNLASSSYIDLNLQYGLFSSNRVLGGTGNQLRMNSLSNNALIAHNYISTGITIDGESNLYTKNMTETSEEFATLATSATAMALLGNVVAKLTPTSTRTLTSTVPPAGHGRTLIILTSGSTSYTLTFGSGFKSTGTLATGVTSSRYFVIQFISDGTNLLEVSRTVAYAA